MQVLWDVSNMEYKNINTRIDALQTLPITADSTPKPKFLFTKYFPGVHAVP
jgi:hypothetical protein